VDDGRRYGVVGAHLSWNWAKERCRVALGGLPAGRQAQVAVFDRTGRDLLKPPGQATSLVLSLAQLQQLSGSRYGVMDWSDGRRYLSAAVRSSGYADYPGLGWTIVVRQPIDVAMASAYDLERRIWGVGLLASLMFGVLGWGLAGRLTAPLRHVAARAREVAASMKLVLDDGGYRRDEVGQLAASLNSLVTQVQQRDQALRALNEDLENRVAERTASLRQANADLESFGRSISHDLKSPLGSMGLMLRRVLGGPTPERLAARDREILSALADECDRLQGLVDGMSALSMVDSRPMQREAVHMDAVVQEVLAGLRTASALSGQGGFPSLLVAPLPEVQGDAVLLRQVWQNLLSNAVKFTSKTTDARVEVRCQREGDAWVFGVIDNGPGFDTARAHELFSMYRRLHDARDYPGTGVGLSIVRRVVQRHGGEVWCHASPGQGARFHFSLPVTVPSAATDGGAAPAVPRPSRITCPGIQVELRRGPPGCHRRWHGSEHRPAAYPGVSGHASPLAGCGAGCAG
jgi:signal transduction histidine kinase